MKGIAANLPSTVLLGLWDSLNVKLAACALLGLAGIDGGNVIGIGPVPILP